MSGSIEYVVRGTPGDFFRMVRHAGEISNAVRVADASASNATQFTGTWKGKFVVRDCVSVGWVGCYPYEADRVHSFTLTLTQAVSQVTGTLTISASSIPVAGTVSGNALELGGAASQNTSGGSEEARITWWSTRRDIVGRMTGSFGLTLEWPGIGDGTRLHSTTFGVVELVSTALED